MGGSFISVLRWPRELGLPSLAGMLPSSLSYAWRPEQLSLAGLGTTLSRAARLWPEFLDLSVVDTVLWSVVTAVESVALVSMMCCFFVFCGCTL